MGKSLSYNCAVQFANLDALENIVDMLETHPPESVQLVFLLLRNLAVPRENKIFYLSNGVII